MTDCRPKRSELRLYFRTAHGLRMPSTGDVTLALVACRRLTPTMACTRAALNVLNHVESTALQCSLAFLCRSERVAFPLSLAPVLVFFFSSRRRHTRSDRDWSSDVCSSD